MNPTSFLSFRNIFSSFQMLPSEHPTEETTAKVLFSSTMEDKTDFVETNHRRFQRVACQTVEDRDLVSPSQVVLMLIAMDIQVGLVFLLLSFYFINFCYISFLFPIFKIFTKNQFSLMESLLKSGQNFCPS